MYDVSGELLSEIKSMYVVSLACFRVKRGESERFMIDGCEMGVLCPLGSSKYIRKQ